jgi:transposase-like protein
MAKRRRFTSEFKARVALEALRGDKTVQEIAARHQVHPNQVSAWKRQAQTGLGAVFERGGGSPGDDREDEVRALHAKIGELTVRNDFLSKALKP